jgi:restriction system protein
MARKRKTSALDDLTEIIALLPWWAAVALGIVGYFVLHAFAVQPVVVGARPGDMMGRMLVAGLATGGQYIFPMLCFVAAIMSAVGRKKRQELVSNVAAAKAPDALGDMTWREFEMLVGEAYRLQGYRVTEMGGNGPDGGIDLVLHKDRERYLVQCKQWKAFKVGVQVVRELYGVMAAQGAAGGYVVTCGRFTAEATEFANGRNVTLVDGPKLMGMINAARASLGSAPATAAASPAPQGAMKVEPQAAPMRPVEAPSVTATPSCPVCSRAMTMRTAKRGANAGGTFWGCTGYPSCKGVRSAT